MTAAVAVLMASVATFTACDKDDDKKDSTEKKEQQDAILQGYVDLGHQSGTLWKDQNESGQDLYTYNEAVAQFGDKLPTKEQLEELKTKCSWQWTGSGYKVTGPNGNFITLPAAGFRYCDGNTDYIGSNGYYWSSTPDGSDNAWRLYFNSNEVDMYSSYQCSGISVRLVYHE